MISKCGLDLLSQKQAQQFQEKNTSTMLKKQKHRSLISFGQQLDCSPDKSKRDKEKLTDTSRLLKLWQWWWRSGWSDGFIIYKSRV